MFVFLLTLPVLLGLALGYLITKRSNLVSLEFAFWLISYQFIFIGLLGIGLVQSHIGCPMPLGDCYVDPYPSELHFIKPATSIAFMVWIFCAISMSLFNLISIWRRKE